MHDRSDTPFLLLDFVGTEGESHPHPFRDSWVQSALRGFDHATQWALCACGGHAIGSWWTQRSREWGCNFCHACSDGTMPIRVPGMDRGKVVAIQSSVSLLPLTSVSQANPGLAPNQSFNGPMAVMAAD
jgi:hypothetical protein